MTEIARLELGRRRPDGTREVAVVDAQGHRHKGVLTDPELVDDYLDYLDSAGLDRPAVTGTGAGEPAPPARAPVLPGVRRRTLQFFPGHVLGRDAQCAAPCN